MMRLKTTKKKQEAKCKSKRVRRIDYFTDLYSKAVRKMKFTCDTGLNFVFLLILLRHIDEY